MGETDSLFYKLKRKDLKNAGCTKNTVEIIQTSYNLSCFQIAFSQNSQMTSLLTTLFFLE